MTAWQDEQGGSPFGGDLGRPTSRREAREAERRRAETMLEKPPHPSGVVDFEAHDFGPEFVPDQAFDVGDTQDIWQALTRGAQAGRMPTGATPQSRATEPQPPVPQPGQQSAMQGDLMDRVREAVLRRQQEPEAPPARAVEQRPAADSQSFDLRVLDQRAPEPQDSQAHDLRGGLSRRERRRLETADLREDGLPITLFDGRSEAPAAPAAQPAAPAPAAPFDEYAEYERQYAQQRGRQVPQYDEDYYDEPYSPEPTISIPVRAGNEPQRADPALLPQAFSEPAGDDALTFSSPVQQIRAEPLDHWAHAEAQAEFSEPDDDWDVVPVAQPKPASAPMPFVEPQQSAAFRGAQVGPPSELTDLAGFEALIRKARQQPAGPAPAPVQQQRPAMAWADDDEADDVQDGFGSLLSRQVQSSHGTSPALILPNDPQPIDLTQAVSGTGDIFVTGTMKLSHRFSSTGASGDHYDSHDIDRLYDATQDEPAAGVAPVRASKAISGASQNRVVTGKPGRGNLLPTVLAIVAGAMAVGVVTLLVGSWVFRIF